MSGSLSPWPVRTQTTDWGGAEPSTTGSPWASRPATEAAEAGSQKTPSLDAEPAVGLEDLLVADRGDPAARAGERRHRLLPASGVSDPDRRGDRLGVRHRLAVDQRRRAVGLEAVEDRRRPQLLEAAPVGGHVAGVADRDRQRPGRLAQLLDDLERRRLLPFDPVGVDRVDQFDRVLLRQLAHDPQRVVEVALQGDDPRPVHQSLGELADRDLPLRHDHRPAQAGARRVGRRAGRGVAGRGADHRLRPAPLGARDGDGHAAVLEGAGRVRPLELEVGAGADPLGEPRRLDQRRRALVRG